MVQGSIKPYMKAVFHSRWHQEAHVRKKGIGYRPARLIRFQSRGTFVVGGGGVVQVKVQSCFKRRKPNKSCPTSEVFWGRALLAVD